jgi:hypothetical protein
MSILISVSSNCRGITHHDVSMHLWLAYIQYAGSLSSPDMSSIANTFRRLQHNDTFGPKLPCELLSTIIIEDTIHDTFVEKLANLQYLNYTSNQIISARVSARVITSGPINLT